MPNVQKICKTCGYKAKRQLNQDVGCRGAHETTAELALCPKGHGPLARLDGSVEGDYHGLPVLTKGPTRKPSRKNKR